MSLQGHLKRSPFGVDATGSIALGLLYRRASRSADSKSQIIQRRRIVTSSQEMVVLYDDSSAEGLQTESLLSFEGSQRKPVLDVEAMRRFHGFQRVNVSASLGLP